MLVSQIIFQIPSRGNPCEELERDLGGDPGKGTLTIDGKKGRTF